MQKSDTAQFVPIKTLSWRKDKKSFKNFFCHLHLSATVNKFFVLPFKGIWAKTLFNFKPKLSLNTEKPFCFIIDARCYEKFTNLLSEYLRKTYKNCKLILYFTDIIDTYNLNILKLKSIFDLIFTFELNDSIKNNIFHYDTPYSKLEINSDFPASDIFFIGQNKSRLGQIIEVYNLLSDNGINCDFNMVNVEKKKQIPNTGIRYIDFMDYNLVIKHIISTQCILEILQESALNPTLRSLEAICYNKKLLTNCKYIKDKNYYNPKYISIFDKPANIDINFVKTKIQSIEYDYRDKLSPLEFVKHIDNNVALR